MGTSPTYLGRDAFRNAVFARDGHRCVICKEPAQDAHHILERRLWTDGGYYLENGASVCGDDHLKAEQTLISCEALRDAAGIGKVLLPDHLYVDQRYDKWGNPILDNGQRLRGELFYDESVQKILAPVLSVFTNRVKYPRTYHLPWSPGVTNDDRILKDLSWLNGSEVVATVKMDGENTTMYRDFIHARSVDNESHSSRDRVKAMHAAVAHDIPEGWRVCGENLFAKHSIHYKGLPAYFMVFSIWNEQNICLDWDSTKEWAALLGFPMVSELYRGPWDGDWMRSLYRPTFDGNPCEGYVVRVTSAFQYKEFSRKVGKYVRAGHVQTHGHWMRQKIEPNELEGT
jgi:hypothetical protein